MKDYLPIFDTDDLTTGERWQKLKIFIETWYEVEIPDKPISTELNKPAIDTHLKLPKSIETFCSVANQLQHIEHIYPYSGQKTNKFSAIFRDGIDLSFLEKHKAFTLLLQAEGDIYWGIKQSDFEEENPKVYSYVLNYDIDDNTFELHGPSNPTVTSFLLNHILLYLSNCSSFGMTVENVDPIRTLLKTNLKNHIIYDGLELFEDKNLIAFISGTLFDEDHFSFYFHLKDNRAIETLPKPIIDMVQSRNGWTSNRFNQFS